MEAKLSELPNSARRSKTLFKLLLRSTVIAGILSACGGSDSGTKWVASWYAAQQDRQESSGFATAPLAKALANQTLRQILYVSAAGSQVRLKFSNLFGTSPVTFGAVVIANPVGAEGAIDSASASNLTFKGQQSLTLAAGAEAYSDQVPFVVTANSRIAVSIYVESSTLVRTVHSLGVQRNFVASGNVASTASPAWTEINATPSSVNGGFTAWVTALDVERDSATKVLVGFGDSITDGYASTPEANRRWPNILSRVLATDAASYGSMSVVNAGISGNRWKDDFAGPKGEGRFERDVLDVSGVTHVVIMLGINDIGFPLYFGLEENVEASSITAAVQSAVDKAKSRGLKVLVGTLTPFKGAAYFSVDNEAKRAAVNTFIRTGLKGADAVVDFDVALRDSADRDQLRPAYDSDDKMHPNDAGYEAMAQTVAAALATLR